jgi:hypothetical protein
MFAPVIKLMVGNLAHVGKYPLSSVHDTVAGIASRKQHLQVRPAPKRLVRDRAARPSGRELSIASTCSEVSTCLKS